MQGARVDPGSTKCVERRDRFISDIATAIAMTGFGIRRHSELHPPANGLLLTRHSLWICHASSAFRVAAAASNEFAGSSIGPVSNGDPGTRIRVVTSTR